MNRPRSRRRYRHGNRPHYGPHPQQGQHPGQAPQPAPLGPDGLPIAPAPESQGFENSDAPAFPVEGELPAAPQAIQPAPQGAPHPPQHRHHHGPNEIIPTLEQRTVRQFQRVALGRGRAYFNAGRAADPVWTDKQCVVQIHGTGGNYNVGFDFSQVPERRLPISCDCPAYVRGVLCKHLWAAILQVDKMSPPGPDSKIPESGTLKLVHANPRARQERQQHPGGQQQPGHPGGHHGPHGHRTAFIAPVKVDPSSWVYRLNQLQGTAVPVAARHAGTHSLAYFVISATETLATGKLTLDLWTRNRMISGEPGPLMPGRVMGKDAAAILAHFDDTRDQEVISLLTRTGEPKIFSPFGRASGKISSRFTVDSLFESHLIPFLASAGKLFLSRSPNGSPDSAERPLRLDRGKTWDLELKVEGAGLENYKLEGFLKRDNETRSLADPVVILKSGFLVFEDRIGRFTDNRHAQWAIGLKNIQFLLPRDQGDALLTRILLDPSAPKLTFPEDMGWSVTSIEPKPKGVFRPLGNDPSTGRMTLTVSFDYAGREIPLSETEMSLVDVAQKRVLQRNRDFEEQTLLKALEILRDPQGTGTVPVSEMHRAANELVAAGWTVYIENQQVRVANDFSLNVSTNTDWFDLKVEADFGNLQIKQAELLKALENKSGLVQLSDGTIGMLPKDFLERFAQVSQFGERAPDGSVRFSKSQGLMLNAAIGDEAHLKADTPFLSFRDKISKFQGVETAKAPSGFKGKLREYQREGLTWLKFLEEFETGGILADDMGLGKTIQVLAFLRGRERKAPNLVVAPKSLTFNWMDEAAKFVPDMKIVRYAGAGRGSKMKEMQEADLVVTTYGAVRTDIEKLKEIDFDIAIVDEAQAIKNAKAQSSQAVKQLKASQRLALTGTPIENSINDLLSILEFTNPGLLSQKDLSTDTQGTLSRMLKPFMLRRTKEKVLTELPDKSEQVLYCEMSSEEREFYNAIRDKYRASIAEKVEKSGLGRSKLHVLEALLRLRQASSHVGLVDPEKKNEPSAKLQLLLNHIEEVTKEGHKCLVFSQFTSLLAIVRPMLEEAGIAYEYLDGQTEDRKSPVERFQTDPKCPVFLISLKAGGTGLNLTAADYVFILDPWWNPAVEAQAIGRAHRMGQTQKVIAYRMITQGTVEEKILELQKTKKDLAESLIAEDKDFLKKLSKEDLEMILA